MSVDIQKQLELKPYSDANIAKKQVVVTPSQSQQPIDEEKSNAAKWMIGLTATAAIVVGGLWAAKKGHLGESAQKYANKLLGSAADAKGKGGTTSTSSSTSASTSSTTSTKSASTPTGATSGSATSSTTSSAVASVAAAIPPLVVARKAISRLIKSPKNLTETIQSLQDAGVAFTRESNLISIKTGKKIHDITYIMFDEAGTSSVIARPNKNVIEAFELNNGSLKSITRQFDGLKTQKLDEMNNPIDGVLRGLIKPLKQTIEFDKSKKVIQETWDVAERAVCEELTLTSVKGLKDSFNSDSMSGWKDFLAKYYDELPESLKKAKIFNIKECVNGEYDTAQYLTARVAKFWEKPLKEVPQDIPSEEFARFLYKKTDTHFTDVVNALNIERNIARRVSDVKVSSEDVAEYITLHRYNSGEIKDSTKALEDFKEFFYNDKSGRKAEVFAKLFKDDLGPITSFNENSITAAVKSYNAKFKAYKLNSDIELMEIAVKPLKECTFEELMKILRVVNPEKAGCVLDDPVSRTKETTVIIKYLSKISGNLSINENTKIFDILKDISL